MNHVNSRTNFCWETFWLSFLLRFFVIKIHMLKMFIALNSSSAALCWGGKQIDWLACGSGQPHLTWYFCCQSLWKKNTNIFLFCWSAIAALMAGQHRRCSCSITFFKGTADMSELWRKTCTLLFQTPARRTEYSSKGFPQLLQGVHVDMLLAEQMTEGSFPLLGLFVVPPWVWSMWWG